MNSKLTMVFRVLLGLILLVFGANKFFHFMPAPPLEGPSADFMGALIATGYMFPLIALTEISAGVLLLINKWLGIAIIFASIMSVNIILFHLFLSPETIAPGAVVFISTSILMYANWNKFKTLF